jgi:hypothetical protein
MVMRTMYPLEKSDMMDFLDLFSESLIQSISLTMYNGTVTRSMELPNGSTAEYTSFRFQAKSKASLVKDLEHVDHNQIQSCEVHLSNEGTYGVVQLNLLNHELSFQEKPTLFSTDKVLDYARKKNLGKMTLRF